MLNNFSYCVKKILNSNLALNFKILSLYYKSATLRFRSNAYDAPPLRRSTVEVYATGMEKTSTG